jgi:hypothetical protein
MKKIQITDEDLRMAREQAQKFTPKEKKRGGRSRYAGVKLKFSDPCIGQKLAFGEFHDVPVAGSLWYLLIGIHAQHPDLTDEKISAATAEAKEVLDYFFKLLVSQNAEELRRLAGLLDLISRNILGLGFPNVRQSFLFGEFKRLSEKNKNPPTAAELIKALREDEVSGAMCKSVSDRSLFRLIAEMEIPVRRAADKKR